MTTTKKGGPATTSVKKATKKTSGGGGGGPKRPLSAYFFFMQEQRPKILQEHPELRSKVAEVAKLVGQHWRKLSEADKEPYNKKAAAEKKRYTAEKAGDN